MAYLTEEVVQHIGGTTGMCDQVTITESQQHSAPRQALMERHTRAPCSQMSYTSEWGLLLRDGHQVIPSVHCLEVFVEKGLQIVVPETVEISPRRLFGVGETIPETRPLKRIIIHYVQLPELPDIYSFR